MTKDELRKLVTDALDGPKDGKTCALSYPDEVRAFIDPKKWP